MPDQKELFYSHHTNSSPAGNIDNHVFEPKLELGDKYYIDGYPDYYFIVREDLHTSDIEGHRICLYREQVINEYLYGDKEPRTLLVSNELRGLRAIRTIIRDMTIKVESIAVSKIIHKH